MSFLLHPRAASTIVAAALFSAVLSACGGGTESESTASGSVSSGSAAIVASDPTVSALKVSALAVDAKTASATDVINLATEGQSFAVAGTQTVQFGVGSSWVQMSVTGTGQCTNVFFGSDPAFGTVKSCQLVVVPTNTTIATEGQSFSVTRNQIVQFGAGTSWVQQMVTGTGQCTNNFFGSDPAFGVVKSCQIASTGVAPTSLETSTTLATEGGSFSVSGTQTVQFGAGSNWVQKSVTGAGQCTIGFFGSDPDYGVVKSCQVLNGAAGSSPAASTSGQTVTVWVRVADMGGTMTLKGSQVVRFGDGYSWTTATLNNGASCVSTSFPSDPAPYTPEFCEVQVTVPAVTQTGKAPVINTALMPVSKLTYQAVRAVQLTPDQLSQWVYSPQPSDIGAFRDPCAFSHMSFDDPIAYPGQPGASHMHTFVGNDSISASTTAANIMAAGVGSTCSGGTLNRTGYWQPTLIDTRTGQPVPPVNGQMYYKTSYLGVTPASVKPFPAGLKMIMGSASATAPVNGSLARWQCLSTGAFSYNIPSCPPGDTLFAGVTFPQCWDGINLDSPDHKSHMAYATGAGCPADHPVPLPEVSIRFDYKVAESNTGDFWKLSSDDYAGPGGYSLHADWFGGWDAATLATFVTKCLNASMDCHDSLLGDGRMLY